MRRIISSAMLMAAACLVPGAAARAADVPIEQTIVYIQCTSGSPPNVATSTGSGVVVSPQGHVLTARHVIEGATSCKGSIGFANPGGGEPLIVQKKSDDVDAALLRFNAPRQYDFVRYCKLEDWMVRRDIYASGFPGGSPTGVPSFRKGVLSTVFPQGNGLLETDGQTVQGMSGGPVFASDLRSFIGVVVGASFSPAGTVNYFGILSTDSFGSQFNLIASDQPCYRRSRQVELPPAAEHWEAGDAPVALGVRPEEGICFLTSVWGVMSDPKDTIEITVRNGEFELGGSNVPGTRHGARVGCIWFD